MWTPKASYIIYNTNTEITSSDNRMNLLSDYRIVNSDTIQKVFEISEAAEESVHYVEKAGLKYGIIKNFYKDPSAVKNFIQENFTIFGSPISNSPGLQLYFDIHFNKHLSHVMKYFHDILAKRYFPTNPTKEYGLPMWESYFNFYWKDMPAMKQNIIPHADDFCYAFNCWITKDIPEGTDFYTYSWNGHAPVHTISEFRSVNNREFSTFRRSLDSDHETRSTEIEWDTKKHLDPEVWNKYHTIKPEYNTVTYYPGMFFHMPSISPSYEENFLRMSQVYTYQFLPPDEFARAYKRFRVSKHWEK